MFAPQKLPHFSEPKKILSCFFHTASPEKFFTHSKCFQGNAKSLPVFQWTKTPSKCRKKQQKNFIFSQFLSILEENKRSEM